MRPASPSPRYIETRIGSRFTPGVIALLVLYGVAYVLWLVPPAERFITDKLLLVPLEALGPRAYQLLIAPALMTSFFGLLFLGILLWSVGSSIEQRTGTKRFLTWMAGASVAASITAASVGRLWPAMAGQPVLFDGQPVFTAVLIAFAALYGSVPVRMWGIGEPVSGRGLSYFFVGLGLFADVLRGQWIQLVAQLAAVGFMLLVLNRQGPRSSSGRHPLAGLFDRLRRRGARRSTLKVLDGGVDGRPVSRPRPSAPRYLN